MKRTLAIHYRPSCDYYKIMLLPVLPNHDSCLTFANKHFVFKTWTSLDKFVDAKKVYTQ
jgi:hypothetical protein